jgi:hypothetical protein
MDMSPVVWFIPYEDGDAPLHSESRPFCSDLACPCHRDDALFQECINLPLAAGLLTDFEGENLFYGRQL